MTVSVGGARGAGREIDNLSGHGMPLSFATTLESIFLKLDEYCRTHDWTGFDPYDALNSELRPVAVLAKARMTRLMLTQALKRCPIDVRGILRTRPQRDPKATALFIMAYVKRARSGDSPSRTVARQLVDRILELRSPGMSGYAWGYSFPWQTRQRLVPRFAPNLVVTVFAANALLDAYELGLGSDCLDAAVSAGEYLARDLYWSDGDQAAFAYPLPDIRVPIHNANLLGSALLCRLSRLTGDRQRVATAMRICRYSASSQRDDGSWPYGVAPTQQWVDNFHTGYNLCALQSIAHDLNLSEFNAVIAKGFAFYRDHFFTADGCPKYFHNRTFPVDIHSVAQSLVTLVRFRGADPRLHGLAQAVLAWAIKHMWDERGFFYYRKLRFGRIRTSYMRWSQAWMLYALSVFLAGQRANGDIVDRVTRASSRPDSI